MVVRLDGTIALKEATLVHKCFQRTQERPPAAWTGLIKLKAYVHHQVDLVALVLSPMLNGYYRQLSYKTFGKGRSVLRFCPPAVAGRTLEELRFEKDGTQRP